MLSRNALREVLNLMSEQDGKDVKKTFAAAKVQQKIDLCK